MQIALTKKLADALELKLPANDETIAHYFHGQPNRPRFGTIARLKIYCPSKERYTFYRSDLLGQDERPEKCC